MTRHEDEDEEPRRLAWHCWGLDYCGADDCERCRPLGEGAWLTEETTDETEVDDDE